jgi:hypothetical protein
MIPDQEEPGDRELNATFAESDQDPSLIARARSFSATDAQAAIDRLKRRVFALERLGT